MSEQTPSSTTTPANAPTGLEHVPTEDLRRLKEQLEPGKVEEKKEVKSSMSKEEAGKGIVAGPVLQEAI